MLKENLIMLRNTHGFSQEEIAEKIDISRQAYAKWESGATVPDIEKCNRLADIYGITIDREYSTCAKRKKYMGVSDNKRSRTTRNSQSRSRKIWPYRRTKINCAQ